jgi:hypothetical protein
VKTAGILRILPRFNGKLKEDYDIKWKQRKVAQNFPIQNEVHIDEFDEDNDFFLTNECRCGGLYILSETDVKFCYTIYFITYNTITVFSTYSLTMNSFLVFYFPSFFLEIHF